MFVWIFVLWFIATHNEWIQNQWTIFINTYMILDSDDEDSSSEDEPLPITHIPSFASLNTMDTYCKMRHDHWIRIFPDFNNESQSANGTEVALASDTYTSFSVSSHKSTCLRQSDFWSNANIDTIFYDRSQLKEVWEDPKNDIEAQWRRRILYESTPRGNVMMHYDVYREGYVYYSDQTSIPYCILNAVAMKYVLMFKCRDLFVDQTVYAHNPSPMIQSMRDEDGKEQDKKNQSMHQLLHADTNTKNNSFAVSDASPFVKFKSKQHDNTIIANASAKVPAARRTMLTTHTTTPLPAIKNKFIYMGKFHNWTPLQSRPKTTVSLPSTTTQFDGIFARADLAQQSVLDYKTYKLMKTSTQ
jgi:hypothetical protein